jgi:hypothetical protein
MNKKHIWLLSILLVLTLACSFTGSKKPTPEQAQPILPTAVEQPPTAVPEPTQPPPPTEVSSNVEVLLAEPTQEEQVQSDGTYYTEEFDGDTSSWYTWVAAGDPSKNFTALKPGAVTFILPSPETYAYFANEAYEYENVYVEAEITAKVFGDNGMAVICRASEDGWYELRVHTTGQYAGSFEVYRYDQNLKNERKNPYVNIMNNIPRVNSVSILNGSKTNVIALLCVGDSITPFINGVPQTLPKEVPITDNVLKSGQVGVGGMSFGNGKVELEVEYVTVESH